MNHLLCLKYWVSIIIIIIFGVIIIIYIIIIRIIWGKNHLLIFMFENMGSSPWIWLQ